MFITSKEGGGRGQSKQMESHSLTYCTKLLFRFTRSFKGECIVCVRACVRACACVWRGVHRVFTAYKIKAGICMFFVRFRFFPYY